MTRALKLYLGSFGRVCLLHSDRDLVTHAHPQYHVLIKAGGADTAYQVGSATYTLNEDAIILVNPWEPHSKTHQPASGPSLVLALFIEPKWLAELAPGLPAGGAPALFPSSRVAMTASIRALTNRMVAVMADADSSGGGETQWEAALSDLVLAIVRSFAVRPALAGVARCRLRRATDPRIARAISFMENHLGESYSSEELARMHCLSRPHFFQLFKECTTVSPALYMNTLRMEAALGELAHDAVSIGQLSDTLGFSEPHHFTRFFRHNLGIPPTEYRRIVTVSKQTGRMISGIVLPPISAGSVAGITAAY